MRPHVTVLATTYFPPGVDGDLRRQTYSKAMYSWDHHLQYEGAVRSQARLRLHEANDQPLANGPREPLSFGIAPWPHPTISHQDRHGVGASLNAGLQIAFESSPLVLYAVDDWILNYDFDLTPWADLLTEREDVGMVRFFPHPWLTGEIEHDAGRWFVRLDRHGFAAATRPFLLHKRFIDTYGWFLEDVNAFDCEIDLGVRFVGHNAHSPGCIEASRLNSFRQCPAGDGCNDEAERGPGIVLAMPSPWDHLEGVELADIDPNEG